MADRRSKQSTAADEARQDDTHAPRPFWSGTLSFGLVSLPVGLYPAQRGSSVSLRMVDGEGTRLRRQFVCSRDGEPLDNEDLVRGYETDQGRYVLVEDEELAALAPKKSREIDLRRFVAREEIDPVFFQRGYFLTPEEGAIKAYRLLAHSMAESARAGIATFVMRGHEYLVAILAEGGILRAETLRFADTLRTPADIGLPAVEGARARDIQRMQGAIKTLMASTADRDALRDTEAEQLTQHAREKLDAGEDVLLRAPEEPEEDEAGEAPPDLMAILKKSLEGDGRNTAPAVRHGNQARGKKTAGQRRKAGTHRHGAGRDDYADATRAQLYALAQEREIAGRSRMNRAELAAALRDG